MISQDKLDLLYSLDPGTLSGEGPDLGHPWDFTLWDGTPLSSAEVVLLLSVTRSEWLDFMSDLGSNVARWRLEDEGLRTSPLKLLVTFLLRFGPSPNGRPRSEGQMTVSRLIGGIEPGRGVGECLTACSAVTWENASGAGVVPADAMRMHVSN